MLLVSFYDDNVHSEAPVLPRRRRIGFKKWPFNCG